MIILVIVIYCPAYEASNVGLIESYTSSVAWTPFSQPKLCVGLRELVPGTTLALPVNILLLLSLPLYLFYVVYVVYITR